MKQLTNSQKRELNRLLELNAISHNHGYIDRYYTKAQFKQLIKAGVIKVKDVLNAYKEGYCSLGDTYFVVTEGYLTCSFNALGTFYNLGYCEHSMEQAIYSYWSNDDNDNETSSLETLTIVTD